jgi:hypothetical protein
MGELLDYDHLRALVKLCKSESPARLQQLNRRITNFIQGNHDFLTDEDIDWLQHMWDTLLTDDSLGPKPLPLPKLGGNMFDPNGFKRFDSNDIAAVILLVIYIAAIILIRWRVNNDVIALPADKGVYENIPFAAPAHAPRRNLTVAQVAAAEVADVPLSADNSMPGEASGLLGDETNDQQAPRRAAPTSWLGKAASYFPYKSSEVRARPANPSEPRRARGPVYTSSNPPHPSTSPGQRAFSEFILAAGWLDDESARRSKIRQCANAAAVYTGRNPEVPSGTKNKYQYYRAREDEIKYDELLAEYASWYAAWAKRNPKHAAEARENLAGLGEGLGRERASAARPGEHAFDTDYSDEGAFGGSKSRGY